MSPARPACYLLRPWRHVLALRASADLGCRLGWEHLSHHAAHGCWLHCAPHVLLLSPGIHSKMVPTFSPCTHTHTCPLACLQDMGGCNTKNSVRYTLRALPHVFTLQLGWLSQREQPENIAATLRSIDEQVGPG